MIGTITWHFQKFVHAMYKEYENLETMLNAIKRLQHRLFVIPAYILVEYHGYVFNVTDEDSLNKFHDFLTHEAL